MTTLKEAAAMALDALEIGHDCAVECANRVHTEYAGYKPHRHAAADKDVAQIQAAIAALRAAMSAPADVPRQLVKVSSTDVEAMLAACLPGGSHCDPQQVADAIRTYCNAWEPADVPALPEPVVWNAYWRGDNDGPSWDQWHDESDPLPDTWDTEAPDEITPYFSASQMRAYGAACRAAPVQPVAWPDVDEFAQHIRWLNGSNKMGAASLAEKLLEWLQSRAAQPAAPALCLNCAADGRCMKRQALCDFTGCTIPAPTTDTGEQR